MRIWIVAAPAAVALMLGATAPARAAFTFGTNLIVNPGAEEGASLGGNSFAIDGWTVTEGPIGPNGFTGFSWTSAPALGFPQLSDPGPQPPETRGQRFFYGGLNSPLSAATQLITGPTPEEIALIDAGRVGFDLDGFFGGFATQNDFVLLTLEFLDAAGGVLNSTTTPPVLAVDRGNVTALVFRRVTGSLPVGTRSMQLTLLQARIGGGSSNDGYADNLSLVLFPAVPNVAAVPEPGSLVLAGLGVAGLIGYRRRKPAAA